MTISKKIEGDIKHKVSVVINRALKEMEYLSHFSEEFNRIYRQLPISEGASACEQHLAGINAELADRYPICEPKVSLRVIRESDEVEGVYYNNKIEGTEVDPTSPYLKSLWHILAMPGPVEVTDDDLAVIASLYAKQST